jgi:hypothetical protein
MKMTYEQFIASIKRKGETIQNLFQKPGIVKNDLVNRARLEVSQTGWPNYRTGNLFRSIKAEERRTAGGKEILLTAGNNIKYASYVEFGTIFMQRRLYMNRTVYNWQKGRSIGAGSPGHGVFPVSDRMSTADNDYKFMSEILKDFLENE